MVLYKDLIEIFQVNKTKSSISECAGLIKSEIPISHLNLIDEVKFKHKIIGLRRNYITKFQKECHYNYSRFYDKNKTWILHEFNVPFLKTDSEGAPVPPLENIKPQIERTKNSCILCLNPIIKINGREWESQHNFSSIISDFLALSAFGREILRDQMDILKTEEPNSSPDFVPVPLCCYDCQQQITQSARIMSQIKELDQKLSIIKTNLKETFNKSISQKDFITDVEVETRTKIRNVLVLEYNHNKKTKSTNNPIKRPLLDPNEIKRFIGGAAATNNNNNNDDDDDSTVFEFPTASEEPENDNFDVNLIEMDHCYSSSEPVEEPHSSKTFLKPADLDQDNDNNMETDVEIYDKLNKSSTVGRPNMYLIRLYKMSKGQSQGQAADDDNEDSSIRKSALKAYLHLKNLQKKVYCQECKISFKNCHFLMSHNTTVHKSRSANCPLCEKSYTKFKSLTNHIAIKHLDFDPKEAERNPSHPKPKCEKCEKSFDSNFKLKNHLASCRHINQEKKTKEKEHDTYFCHVCGKEYGKKVSFLVHLRSHQPPLFECQPPCNKKFWQKYKYKLHNMRVHEKSAVPQFSCDLCNYRGYSNFYLKRHKSNVHDKIKDFLCSLCGKSYKNNSLLKEHYICQHTNEKPYKCPKCDRTYAKKLSLTTHLKSHDTEPGTRPFICTLFNCNRTFATKDNLRIHRIKTHKIKKNNTVSDSTTESLQ